MIASPHSVAYIQMEDSVEEDSVIVNRDLSMAGSQIAPSYLFVASSLLQS